MILYFSATGNSRHVADMVSNGDKLVDIAECVKNGNYSFELADSETLGIISPTYFWGLPSIVKDFLIKSKIKINGIHYTYFIATYGMLSGNTGKAVSNIFYKKGIDINARFSVRMPDTWTPIFDLSDHNKINMINKNAEKQILDVAKKTNALISGDFMKNKLPSLLSLPAQIIYQGARRTSHLNVSSSCIGCGSCADQCPANAIQMKESKPVWVKKKCVMCLGCMHKCPVNAIRYGKGSSTKKHGQYKNPYVKI